MLIRRITFPERDDKIASAFKTAMGADLNVPWPLPNMKPSSETEFWGEASYHGFEASAYGGQRNINGEWATILAYFSDSEDLAGGGFVAVVFKRYQHERVEYYRWSACDHAWTSRRKSNCLHEYRCEKCGATYDIDSSG